MKNFKRKMRLLTAGILTIQSAVFLYAQDCNQDTVAPVIVCRDSLALSLGWCGTEKILAMSFLLRAEDSCPFVISFDKDRNFPGKYYTEFYAEYGDQNYIPIYVTDSSGNQSSCQSFFYHSNRRYYTGIGIGLNLYTEFFRNDWGHFILSIQDKKRQVHSASIDLLQGGIIAIPVSDIIEPDSVIISFWDPDNTMPSLVSSADVVQILKHIAGIHSLRGTSNEWTADMNNDGILDIRDAKILTAYLFSGDWDEAAYGPMFYAAFLDDQWGPVSTRGVPYGQNAYPGRVYRIALDQKGNINQQVPVRTEAADEKMVNFPGPSVHWRAFDRELLPGQSYSMPLLLSDARSFWGIQTALAFDTNKIRVVRVSGRTENAYRLYSTILPGQIRFALANLFNQNVTGGLSEMVIDLVAKERCKLSKVLAIGDAGMSSFLLNENNDPYPVQLRVEKLKMAPGEEWRPPKINVYPNPPNGRLNIELQDPCVEPCQWVLYDGLMRPLASGQTEGSGAWLELRPEWKGTCWLVISGNGQRLGVKALILE
jgi:hypothetical protein